MPTYSKNLSQRLSRYIGVNEHSPWGRRAAELGINALKGHGPVAVKCLDFGEVMVPNAAAMLAQPLAVTLTDVPDGGAVGATSPTTIGNCANGYLSINPGSRPDTGTNYQWNVASVPSSLMQFLASPNSTISTTRDIFWGIRTAFSCGTSAWGTAGSGKVFMGLAKTDVNVFPSTTGVMTNATLTDGIGFLISELGLISLVSTESTGSTITQVGETSAVSSLTNLTMATLIGGTAAGGTALSKTNVSWTAAHFHDWAFHAHWGSIDATSAASFVEFYFDGKLVGSISGAGKLPPLTVDLFNTIEILNGDATGIVDMGVAEIINATPRLHITL